MADFFSTWKSSGKGSFEELCVIYVLYFDEARGHIPLIIYPIDIDNLKENKKFMRPVKFHPIWFLDVEEQSALDHIDLEFKNFTFFGKKFLTMSKRQKRRAGLKEETPETIVLIVSLPKDIDIFGDEILREMTKTIRENFEEKLFKIIEYEIAKKDVIKTDKVKKIIKEGKKIKEELYELLERTSKDYFSRAIKQVDNKSIRQQKAISYLLLKGIDVSHIHGTQSDTGFFSNIKIFEPKKKSKSEFSTKAPFTITNVNVTEVSREIEIMVKNNSEKEVNNIEVKITHVKEFFEKEVMNQIVDIWFAEEELIFISPIIPQIKEYHLFLSYSNQKLLSKKIDINKYLKKTKS